MVDTILEKINQLAHFTVMLALIVFGIFIAITYGKALHERLRLKKLSGLKKGSWSTASGLVFGRNALGQIVYAPTDKDGKHSFVLGGSGTGKTSAVLIPCLSHFNGNFLAVDISGDISAAVHKEGSLTFAPCEPDTVPYNVFALIDSLSDNPQAQFEQLEKLAFLLMPDIPGSKDASLFFNTEGRKILTAAFTAFYYAGMDFPAICRKIISSSCSDLFREIDAQKVETASLLIRSFRGSNEANTNGCKQAADGAIKLFGLNANIQKSVRRPGIGEIALSPSTLEERSIFFRIPEEMLDVYAPLLSIVVSQCLAHFASRPIGAKPSILLALDEFASLNMDSTSIVSALQRFRKRNVSIMIVAQSMAALDRLYGEITRKDMLNNFSYKIVLHAGDADTQTEIAKMIGHKKEKSYSKTSGHGAASYTEKEENVWAIEPEELSRLGDHLILIHPAGFERLRKTPFYKFNGGN